ncbi:MAG: tripartite tricarboxylate transporter TctB family protein [Candidatus Heteroscillospira sp.]|jgi:putative tricarboxylic transport membrane protein
MKLNRTQVVGIIFMAIAVFFASQTPQIQVGEGLFEPGARIFPYIAEGIIFVCALLMTIFARGKQFDANAKESKPYLDKAGWKRLGLAAVLMAAYAVLLSLLGFLISTPIATLAFIFVLSSGEKVNKAAAVIIALALTAGIYMLFTNLFSIPLPSGMIFKLF